LYHLGKDPGETTDVAAENPGMVKKILAIRDRLIADGRSTPGTPQQNDVAVNVTFGN